MLAAALAAGGCSVSYRLGSLLGPEDEKAAETAITGSIPGAAASVAASGSASAEAKEGGTAGGTGVGEADLGLAKLAISDALGTRGTTRSTPWENPLTGARGTVTPLSATYRQGGRQCRDFLASHVREGRETWLEGGACETAHGRWEVLRLKPWKQA